MNGLRHLAWIVTGRLLALMVRFRSRRDDSFAAKLSAALRPQVGGHAVREAP